jgi:hypothetical protein
LSTSHEIEVLEELNLHARRRRAVRSKDSTGDYPGLIHGNDNVLKTLPARHLKRKAGKILTARNNISVPAGRDEMTPRIKVSERELSFSVGKGADLKLIQRAYQKNARACDGNIGSAFANRSLNLR